MVLFRIQCEFGQSEILKAKEKKEAREEAKNWIHSRANKNCLALHNYWIIRKFKVPFEFLEYDENGNLLSKEKSFVELEEKFPRCPVKGPPEIQTDGYGFAWEKPYELLGGNPKTPGFFPLDNGKSKTFSVCGISGMYLETIYYNSEEVVNIHYLRKPDKYSLNWLIKKWRKNNQIPTWLNNYIENFYPIRDHNLSIKEF